MKKLLTSLLVAAMMLTGCSGNDSSSKLTEFRDTELQANEVETWNILNTYQARTIQVLANFSDGLLEFDSNNKIVASAAEKWEANEDSTVWTFHIRKGMKWLDQAGNEVADVTAHDFVTAAKYILTQSNGSNNSSQITGMVKGASEFYTATDPEAPASQEELDKLWEQVGIKAVDDYTLEYTMITPTPYFDTCVTYASYYPAPTDFLNEKGEAYGTTPENILYSGCYRLTEYNDRANKTMVKNDKYWDVNNVSFDKVTVLMIESANKAFELFQTGEVDRAALTQEQVRTEIASGNEQLIQSLQGPYAASAYFNWTVNESLPGAADWNKAVRNENFRKAFYHGLDFTEDMKRLDPTDSYTQLIVNTFTPEGLCQTSDGTDYTKVGPLADYAGEGVATRLDANKFNEYKTKAMEELSAKGVSFPITMYLYYQEGNQTSVESYEVRKAGYIKALGEDFIKIEPQTFLQKSSEITKENKHSMLLGNGWGADYGDPYNFLIQITDLDGATMNPAYSHMTTENCPELAELNNMVEAANKIVDLDDRYMAFAEAEAYALEHALVIPGYAIAGNEWIVTKVNQYSVPNPKYGSAHKKYKYWEAKAEAYTAEDMKALKEKNPNRK